MIIAIFIIAMAWFCMKILHDLDRLHDNEDET
jgi:hypothetical protein